MCCDKLKVKKVVLHSHRLSVTAFGSWFPAFSLYLSLSLSLSRSRVHQRAPHVHFTFVWPLLLKVKVMEGT